MALIDSIPDPADLTFDFGAGFTRTQAHWSRDKNLRDVLVHLGEWHHLLLEWVRANQRGERQPFLPEPYNWRTYGQMNAALWSKHQSTSLADALGIMVSSHRQVLALIEQFSTEDLFEKRRFAWTGTSTLGSYCVSTTSSHYDWAIKKITTHLKANPESGGLAPTTGWST